MNSCGISGVFGNLVPIGGLFLNGPFGYQKPHFKAWIEDYILHKNHYYQILTVVRPSSPA
jgi:hypothetical protein